MSPRTIAVINQKGGTAKTTTTVNLAAALAEQGHRVLVVDLDAQCSATNYLDTVTGGPDVLSVLLRQATVVEAAAACAVDGLQVLAASPELSGVGLHLRGEPGAEARLRLALQKATTQWDFVLLDCPGDLGLLSLSALTAATEVLVPVTTGAMELAAVAEIRATVAKVGEFLNPGITISHVLACRADVRRRLDLDVIDSLRGAFPDELLDTVISERVRLRESYSHRQPITQYDPDGTASQQYRDAATEITKRSA